MLIPVTVISSLVLIIMTYNQGLESKVTRHFKDSIARSRQNMTGKSFEDKVRHLTEITSNLINEIPMVASKIIQIANKKVSVGKVGINSIDDTRNSISVDKNRKKITIASTILSNEYLVPSLFS